MNILNLIKSSGSIRKFKAAHISSKLLDKIIEAGVWGPSLFGVQPWRFIVIKKRKIIKEIAEIVRDGVGRREDGLSKLLLMTANVIESSNVLIAVYTNGKVVATAARYGKLAEKRARMAELLATGATVQNMFLMLNCINLGGVWLDAPTLFSSRINKVLEQDDELVVFLSIGVPNQEIRRSFRSLKNLVKII